MNYNLDPYITKGAQIERAEPDLVSLSITPGEAGIYRWAQMDDYHKVSRTKFPWQSPLKISLQARCSIQEHAGTWGFGLWNDPFSASLGLGGMARRLPALPNCAWFFYASHPNHLEIHDRYPANGFLAATFQSPRIPTLFLLPAFLGLPLLVLPYFAKQFRKRLRPIIKQDAVKIPIDLTQWHSYQIDWSGQTVNFMIDETQVLSTNITPKGRLGLVIWIDNQYAAFPLDGKIRFGTLSQETESTLEIKGLEIIQS
ncbi:MAG: hypothetical protein ACYDH1_11675 [Anaerolineaceae bacterium]